MNPTAAADDLPAETPPASPPADPPPADPRGALLLDVTVLYQDGVLKAAWPPAAEAYAYHAEASDATGTVVGTARVDAASYAPPVAVTDPGFTPADGAAYTVRAWVVGEPSAPAAIQVVQLPAPIVTARSGADGTVLSWTGGGAAELYDVRVTGPDGGVAYHAEGIAATSVEVGTAQGLVPGTEYQAVVRGSAGACWGPWSDPAAFGLASAGAVLAALQQRLVAARTRAEPGAPWAYPLDETTFPAGAPGNPDAVLAVLQAALGTDLVFTSPGDPVLNDAGDALELDGTMAVLGGLEPPAGAAATFSVPSGTELQAVVRVAPPAGWTLADAWPVLLDTPYDHLPAAAPLFAVSTWAHAEPDFFYPLGTGLHYQSTLAVQAQLLPVTVLSGQAGVQTVRVGGPAAQAGDGRPSFAFRGEHALAALSLARVGQGTLALPGATVSLRSVPAAEGAGNVNEPRLAATVGFGGGTVLACEVDVPTADVPLRTLATAGAAAGQATLADALAAAGMDDVVGALLPASLLQLAGATLTSLEVCADPGGDAPTLTTATVSVVDGTWPLVPALGLAVSDVEFSARVQRSPAYGTPVRRALAGEVSGMLALGGASYAVAVGVPLSGPWYAVLADTARVPTLQVLAGLVGLQASSVIEALPAGLQALANFSVSEVYLAADPVACTLAQVSFTLAAGDWTVFPGFTLANWSLATTLAQDAGDEWQVSGVLAGQVTLGSGGTAATLDVTLPVPIRDGQWWRMALAEGSTAYIPTLGEVIQLFGGPGALLPVGISSLGGLRVTQFSVSFDPATMALRHLAFDAAQAGDWTIIPGQLVVGGVAGGLSLRAGSGPAQAYGYVRGLVTVAGAPLDGSLVKNDYGGDWLLEAGVENPVHVPGWSSLDAWLSPDSAAAYFPPTLPLFDGMDVSDVRLRFDGSSGSLVEMGFHAECADFWTLVPDRLSITDVVASIDMPYPVVFAGITGSISGVVTLAGAPIAVEAARPQDASPWAFTGSLAQGYPVDLVAAANALAAVADLALPADITRYGFPASVTLLSADARAVPDTGTFHLDGAAGFDWSFDFGLTRLSILGIGGVLDVARTDAPLVATVGGSFAFAGLVTTLALTLGTQDTETVLVGSVAPADAPRIQIPGITDAIAAETAVEQWAQVIPRDLVALDFASAAAYLNLTRSRFLVYGSIDAGALRTDAFVYTESVPGQGGTAAWTYAVALSFPQGFRFGAVVAGLSVIDDVLRITRARALGCDMGGRTLGQLAAETTTLLAQIAPGSPAPLDGLQGSPLPLARGFLLDGQIDFSWPSIFQRILQIGSGQAPPAVAISAWIDAANSVNSLFQADLPDILVLSTLLFTHTDAYPGIHLEYAPGDAHLLWLVARLRVNQVFGDNFVFDVSLAIDDAGLTSFAQQTQQSLDAPWQLPGIAISGLSVTVAYTWAVPARHGQPAVPETSQFTLTGHCLFGPAPAPGTQDTRLSFAAKLALVNGAPALMYVAIDRDWSVGAFIAQCVTGSGSVWPSDFIDVALLNGSRIQYYDAAADPHGTLAHYDGFTFVRGYRLDALVRVTLVIPVSVHGWVQVLQDPHTGEWAGVSAGMQLDQEIDLVFVQCAGTTRAPHDGPYTGGPVMEFQTWPSDRFVLSSGINFLHTAFFSFDVAVGVNGDGRTQFDGRLQTAEFLEPFGQLSCSFTYVVVPNGDDVFTINDWPDFTWVADLVDFVGGIEQIADAAGSDSVCGALAELVEDYAYDSSFDFHAGVTSAGTDLVFSLSGSYSLTVRGAGEPFITATSPAFAVHVPASTPYDQLPSVLAQGVANAGTQFAQDLLDDPADLAMFLAMLFGPDAVNYALGLVCRGLADAAVAAATEAAVDAIAAVGGVLAAGAVAAAATAIAAVLAGTAGSGSGGGGGGGGGGGSTVGTPVLRSLAYVPGVIAGAWDAAGYAAGYDFEVLRPDGSSLGAQSYPYVVLAGSVPADAPSLAPGTYQGRVRATHGSQASGWSVLPLVKPASPVLALSWTDGVLTAAWDDPRSSRCTVRFLSPDGTQLGADQVVSQAPFAASVPLPEPVAGLYSARALVDADGGIPADWGPAATLDVLSVPAPVVQSAAFVSDALKASWTGPQGAAYEAQARDGSTVAASAATQQPGATLLPAAGTSFRAAAAYTFAVRARETGGMSPWTTRDLVYQALPAPAGLAVTNQAGLLTATWQPVEAAVPGTPVRYDTVFYPAADPARGIPADGLEVTGISRVSTGMEDGEAWSVQVRATAPDNQGPWCPPVECVIVNLLPPAEVTLSLEDGVLTSRWTAVPVPAALAGQTLVYDADLEHGVGENDIDTSVAGVEGTSTALPLPGGQAPAVGRGYRSRVRTRCGAYMSDFTVSASFTLLDTVQIVQAGWGPAGVTVAWTASMVAGAGYEVLLAAPSGAVAAGATAPAGAEPAAATWNFPPEQVTERGTFTAVVRVTLDGGAGEPSAPVAVAVLDAPADLVLAWDAGMVHGQWSAAAGAQGYRLDLYAGGQAVASSTVQGSPPPTSTAVAVSSALAGQICTGTVAALADGGESAPSTTASVVLLAAPQNVRATCDGQTLYVAWNAVAGAVAYTVDVLDAAGAPLAPQPPVRYDGPSADVEAGGLDVGATYGVRVRAGAWDQGPWSAVVPVVVPAVDYTCLCLGCAPGTGCGNNGRAGDFTDVFLNVSQQSLDGSFHPTRTPSRTGWVATRSDAWAPLEVLAQLVIKLVHYGIISDAQAYDVFNLSTPHRVLTLPGGPYPYTCLCLGFAAGAGCGNDGAGGAYSGVFLNVSQHQLDTDFHPTRTSPRTGWVAVDQEVYSALSVLLQIVYKLFDKGVLQGSDPYDVFNAAMSNSYVAYGQGGSTTCVCLGSPVGGRAATGQAAGAIYLDVSQSELMSTFKPTQTSPRTGWVAVGQLSTTPLSVILQLVTLLWEKGILTDTEPWDVFNSTMSCHVQS